MHRIRPISPPSLRVDVVCRFVSYCFWLRGKKSDLCRLRDALRPVGSSTLNRPGTLSITIQLELPEALAAKARAKGLLNPAQLTQMIARQLADDEDSRSFFQMAHEIRSVPGEPMSMDQIQKIVDEVRAERASREAGR